MTASVPRTSGVVTSELDGVVSVTINRPKTRNSLDVTTLAQLTAAIESSREARCVVLRSAGDVFCAGGDLNQLERRADDRANGIQAENLQAALDAGSLLNLVRAMRSNPAPIVGRIQGAASGGGAALALACDIRVAADSAWLQESWINVGLVSPLGDAAVLTAAGGSGFALDALLTARRIDAAECFRLGLFQRVVAADLLDAAVESVVNRIVSLDADAVAATKRLVRLAAIPAIEAGMSAGLDEQLRLLNSPGFPARVRKLLETLRART